MFLKNFETVLWNTRRYKSSIKTVVFPSVSWRSLVLFEVIMLEISWWVRCPPPPQGGNGYGQNGRQPYSPAPFYPVGDAVGRTGAKKCILCLFQDNPISQTASVWRWNLSLVYSLRQHQLQFNSSHSFLSLSTSQNYFVLFTNKEGTWLFLYQQL